MKEMMMIGELAAEVVRDAGSKRFGLKEPATEAAGQVDKQGVKQIGSKKDSTNLRGIAENDAGFPAIKGDELLLQRKLVP